MRSAVLWCITYFSSWFFFAHIYCHTELWCINSSHDLLLTQIGFIAYFSSGFISCPDWSATLSNDVAYYLLLLMIDFSHRLGCRAELLFITSPHDLFFSQIEATRWVMIYYLLLLMIYRLECRAELWFIIYFSSWFIYLILYRLGCRAELWFFIYCSSCFIYLTDLSAALSYDLLLTFSHDLQIGVPRWVMMFYLLLLMIYLSHFIQIGVPRWVMIYYLLLLMIYLSHFIQIGVPRWVMIFYLLLLVIYFSHRLKRRAELWFATYFFSWFTDWSAALSYITDGETEEHLEMLDGGVIKQLLDEKWKTYAQVFFRVNTFRENYRTR